MAEIGDFKEFESAAQLAAYAGLSPKQFQSGSSVHKQTRISKQGKRELRKVVLHTLCKPIFTSAIYK